MIRCTMLAQSAPANSYRSCSRKQKFGLGPTVAGILRRGPRVGKGRFLRKAVIGYCRGRNRIESPLRPHCAHAPGPAPRSLCKRQIRRAAAQQKTSASCVKQLSSQSPQFPASPTPLPVAYPPNAVVTIFSDGCVRLLGDRSHPARPRHIWPRHQLRRPKIGPALRGAARDRSLARRALRGQIGILSARP